MHIMTHLDLDLLYHTFRKLKKNDYLKSFKNALSTFLHSWDGLLVIHGLVCDHDVFSSFMDWFVIMRFTGHSLTGL